MPSSATTVRIGCGSGYAMDKLGPAVDLAASGRVDYLAFDMLAERTLAQAQMQKRDNPKAGYNSRLGEIVTAMAPYVNQGLKVIGNFGAANVPGALDETVGRFRDAGMKGLRIAAIHGDDALPAIRRLDPEIPGVGLRVSELGDRVVSANFYLGAARVTEALDEGANWVLGGRIGDASLFVGPICHAFGWSLDDWDRVAHATLVGHLLECSTQITGGYFADPPFREIPDLHRLGFPFAEVRESDMTISKLATAGGRVDQRTVASQVAYEVHDPAAYLTPDVSANFTQVTVEDIGPDEVRVQGATGAERPSLAKVLVGVKLGYRMVGEIGYAAAGCVERAQLAAETHKQAVAHLGEAVTEIRYEEVGLNALVGPNYQTGYPAEVRLRIAAHCHDMETANVLASELDHLYIHGPAGGGGVTHEIRSVIGVYPLYVDAGLVEQTLEIVET